ncbi:uncharacterized protein TrAtP1_007763 [Trichoderma atroviride]|uniref:Uncharacterized protein n=1 Tax=Hypocrea atroviridis (strain ATCC 20476 / IMI 206040) TaxID=452589 RepID=G9NH10_HYPAI|nr:uncharacterized protein TRIATDRAFT_304179 [Trichoderma atroviride IMI 206040]EHK49906.1 hypothetical protein TRIATDRAFT_304179 [Trichoderma atroviride IMI 206040]UKZ66591.1 hypothetical protein TrAtP1_007763 [Trichoderma atroviride]
MERIAMLSRRELSQTTTTYIVIGVVVGVTCTVAVIAILVFTRRRGQKYSALRKNSQLRKRRSSALDRESYRKSMMSTFSEVDDAQRQAMIRKSLATRSSTMDLNVDAASIRTTTTHPLEAHAEEINIQSPQPQQPLPPPSRDEEELMGLRDDWKEWEARLNANYSPSLGLHPALSPRPALDSHPAPGPHPALGPHPAFSHSRNSSNSSNSSTRSAGAYLLAASPPSRCHLGLSTNELDRRSLPPMTRPHSNSSVRSNRSLPANYEVERDPRTLLPSQASQTRS